jgi:hypothetical protein
MESPREDLVELFDYVWQRFRQRMDGLTDDEWRWRPTADDRITLRWRLDHITRTLSEERVGPWLGLPAATPVEPAAGSAAQALANVEAAYRVWRGKLGETTDASLGAAIGAAAGRYGDASRYSFALHIVDELVHHAAEAALLRDLYAGTTAGGSAGTP